MRLSANLLVLALCACAAPQPLAPQRQPVELADRHAGVPQQCVTELGTEPLRVSETDNHVLLYGRGKTIWANELGPPCGFSINDTLVTRPIAGRYCRGDVVGSFDRMSRIPGPSCVLNDFVPYTRPPR
jgi:hypothetical protein